MSAWLWLVAFAAAGLWWAVNREGGGKSSGFASGAGHGKSGGKSGGKGGGGTFKRLLNFALWCIAIVALFHAPMFDTYIAEIMAFIITKAMGLIGIGVPAGAIAEIALWILLIAAGIDLKGARVDLVARAFIVAAPALALVSTGPLGDGVETALAQLNGGSVQVVQDLAH